MKKLKGYYEYGWDGTAFLVVTMDDGETVRLLPSDLEDFEAVNGCEVAFAVETSDKTYPGQKDSESDEEYEKRMAVGYTLLKRIESLMRFQKFMDTAPGFYDAEQYRRAQWDKQRLMREYIALGGDRDVAVNAFAAIAEKVRRETEGVY